MAEEDDEWLNWVDWGRRGSGGGSAGRGGGWLEAMVAMDDEIMEANGIVSEIEAAVDDVGVVVMKKKRFLLLFIGSIMG